MSFIKDYLTFTRSERNGLFVLLGIILVLIFAIKYSYVYINDDARNVSQFENEINNFQKSLVINDSIMTNNKTGYCADSIKLQYFNPNHTADSTWKQLGLKEKQIKVINNYLSKGGKFYRKEDMKKIYSINEKQFQLLEPYIVLKTNEVRNVNNNIANFIIELNSADTTELKKIHQLDKNSINRIIKYRNLLGGFYSKDQLLEVYGIKQKLYDKIEKYFFTDTSIISKIDINTASIKDLIKSPYINYNEAKSIVMYRYNNKFDNIFQLLTFNILSKEKFDKVKHYFVVL